MATENGNEVLAASRWLFNSFGSLRPSLAVYTLKRGKKEKGQKERRETDQGQKEKHHR